ncbi:MAG: FAD-dependent oxidoreductase [Pseudomonadota bacterium]|nr:FAD-dependent oxidoreductase [Pseudomonadota bacterium]
MKRLSRRSFLAASALAMAMPALRSVSEAADVDVVIIGAGAAGIAAARRLAGTGRRVVLLEAAASPGGRCITDTRMFGLPYDLGAHWLHAPDINPVAKLAPRTGLDVYPAPPGQKLRIGRRNAREGEMEDFLGGLVRAQRAIAEAARGKTDPSCSQALPRDLGEWRPSVEFVLGPFGCGKDLSEISAVDFAKSAERNIDAYCRQGLGALLAKFADGLTIELATPATLIDARSTGIQIETGKGRFGTRAVIVTPSTNVLASGAIKFMPDLPKRQLDALSKLTLGTYERIALELAGNPLGLQRDDLVFEKAQNIRTAALLANVSGTTLSYVDVGGKFARELAPRGRGDMTAFALEWLGGLYGSDLKKSVRRSHATQWSKEPWILGGVSAAAPGAQPSRRVLMEPMREHIFFAGEAVHETMWGTLGGAWESGERAADAVLKLFAPPARAQQPARSQKPKRRRG